MHVAKNQEPGLYWYHPHVHGETNYQVGEGGMSGAIIVNGLERHLPRLAKMTQHVIIVRDTGNGEAAQKVDGNGGMAGMATVSPQTINNEPCGPETGLTTSLNYIVQPDITIAPGEKQFFRVINATGHKTLKLAVDGEKLTVVAIDGFALDTYPGTPPTLVEPYAVVPPAARVEFVVTGPRSRSAKFRTLCYDTGSGGDRDPELVLANLKHPSHLQGERSSMGGPITVGEPLPANVYTTSLPPVSAKRVVAVSYTHLDVYKRQGNFQRATAAGFEPWAIHPPAKYLSFGGKTPCSTSHPPPLASWSDVVSVAVAVEPEMDIE